MYPDLRLGLARAGALRRALRAHAAPSWCTSRRKGRWAAPRCARRAPLGLPVTSDFRTNFHAYSRTTAWLRWRPLVMRYLRGFHNRTAAHLRADAERCATS